MVLYSLTAARLTGQTREAALLLLNLNKNVLCLHSLLTPYVQGLLDYTFCSMKVSCYCSLLQSVSRAILLLFTGKQSSIQKPHLYQI